VLLVQRLEEFGESADRLRGAEIQVAPWLQGVVENGDHFLLQPRFEVDHQVATNDDVKT
jgi:hypothetical protein